MKTKEQILKWLDEQPWANEFHRAVFMLRTDLNLSYNESFISKAFDWADTKSGTCVWAKRDVDFRQWYNSNDKPLSWEEFCKQCPVKADECYYIDGECDIVPLLPGGYRNASKSIHTMSKDLCEAFLAYMKLIQLRNAWVKDYAHATYSYKIEAEDNGIMCKSCDYFMYGLSFPTPEMADEFMETFRDLLEVAKPLL